MERWNKNCNGYCHDYQDKDYILHPVSKLDTLVGIAIKYGVEVADIKKINGLSTDRQMFGLNSLQIPLPGKHPPSPSLSNGHEVPRQYTCDQTSQQHLYPFQSLGLKLSPERKVSPAMSSLQGYHGLKPTVSDGFEMTVYRKGEDQNLEDFYLPKSFPTFNMPLDSNRRSKSYANVNHADHGELDDNINVVDVRISEPDERNKKLVRRRQKSEVDLTSQVPEMVLKEENGSLDGNPAIIGKSLLSRTKSALEEGAEKIGLNHVPFILGDYLLGDQLSSVKKSSSTSNLQDQSSIWPTSKWDLQALSPVAIAKPIFDGLQNPITGRRNKTALD